MNGHVVPNDRNMNLSPSPSHKILTIHAPLAGMIATDVLQAVARSLRTHVGVEAVWISHESLPDLVVMARAASGVLGGKAG